MPVYPNDPGLDKQQESSYHPDTIYRIITEEAFKEAMRLQTEYSYKAALKLAKECAEMSEARLADVREDLNCTNEKINKIVSVTDAAITDVRDAIKATNDKVSEVMDHVSSLEDELHTRMTIDDRQLVLRLIYQTV